MLTQVPSRCSPPVGAYPATCSRFARSHRPASPRFRIASSVPRHLSVAPQAASTAETPTVTPQDTSSSSPSRDADASCTALIVGAGPAGFTAANMLVRRGYRDVRIVDRVPGPGYVNKHRAYMYNLSPAGKAALRELGMDDVDDAGLTATGPIPFSYCHLDGSLQNKMVAMNLPGATKATAGTWLSRPDTLRYLSKKTQELCGDAVTVEYSCQVVDVEVPPDGSTIGAGAAQQPTVTVEAADGKRTRWRCQLLVAGDGFNSAVRAALDCSQPGDFQMQLNPSKTGGLHFKGLPVPANPVIMSSAGPMANHVGTIVVGKPAFPGFSPLRLGLLPSGNPDEPRSANVIQYGDHPIWQVATTEELYSALEASFPQFDTLRTTVTPEIAQSFVDEKPGVFPMPQHCSHLVAAYQGGQEGGEGGAEGKQFVGSGVVLLGDAAHAFPPDLGQGVNASLLDVKALGRHVDAHPGDLPAALKAFEAEQLPEHQALINLMQVTDPYQYPCVGSKLERVLHKAGLVVELLAHKAMPFVFAPPTILQLSPAANSTEVSYIAIKESRISNGKKLRALGAAILLAAVSLLFLQLFR